MDWLSTTVLAVVCVVVIVLILRRGNRPHIEAPCLALTRASDRQPELAWIRSRPLNRPIPPSGTRPAENCVDECRLRREYPSRDRLRTASSPTSRP